MAYYDAIANAIGARGNALAQGALQSGQVWGNLAANLGQIPGQAIAFHQQRQDALQNHELKKMALEKAQRDAEIEKSTIRIVNSNAPDEQKIAELENVLSGDPEKFLALQRLKSENQYRQQQTDVQRYKILEGQPGTQFQRPITPPPANALAPGEMAPQVPMPQRQMEFETMVHPAIPGLGAPATDVQQHEAKVAKIKGLGLDPDTEKLAIEALVVPAGILSAQMRGSSSPQTALGITEWVSPDGTQKMYTQAMRNGLHVESGTGKILDPGSLQGWTKIFHVAPQAVIDQQSNVNLVNKEEALRQMQKGGTLSAKVPGIRAAETKAPLVDPNTGVVSGQWGSRSGLGGMSGQGTTQQELAKSPRSKTEIDARTYMDTALSQLDQIKEISGRRPDLIGPYDSFKENVLKRGFGQQEDPDANNLYGALDRFKEDLIRAKEGAVIPPEMYNRLSALVAGKAWSNEQQFATDMENAANVLRIAREKRGMGTAPAGGETKVVNGVSYRKVQGGWQKQKQ